MCGICGFAGQRANRPDGDAILEKMGQQLRHRGPDAVGHSSCAGASLLSRRLSIIDLETGDQPIANEDRSVWVVFNGEIYNYRALAAELEQKGHTFRSRSDTEVIVHAYEEYGTDCFNRFNGMFAIALWDERRQLLLLARDRLGIKPLYYWADKGQLIFGSELKALLQHPDMPRELDLVALDQFLTLEYIPWPRTIFASVRKLPPGHRLLFQNGDTKLERYWELSQLEVTRSRQEHAARLRELLDDAVRARLVSDVPLGAFLSGGIDSSTIVAFMSRHMREPVKTFSIGFGEASYNEVAFAREVAIAFGTDHREEVLQPDIAEMAHSLIVHFDEPFADFSVFPTYLVSRLARESVKVVLSGDGGDEVLAGYDTYVAQAMDRAYRWLPAGIRQGVMPALANRLPPQRAKKGAVNKVKRFVEGAALPAELQHARWMLFLAETEKARLYRWDYGGTAAAAGVFPFLQAQFALASTRDPLAQQQYVDIKTYLAEDILTKVDRMSMRASLEARVPFLDHRLVEFAINLPPELKLHRGVTKVLLREAMVGILPEAVLRKPKEGFSIPIKHWLRDSLKPLMLDLLAPDLVARRGYFEPDVVRAWVDEHLNLRANHSHRLWALMVFEIWYRSVYE